MEEKSLTTFSCFLMSTTLSFATKESIKKITLVAKLKVMDECFWWKSYLGNRASERNSTIDEKSTLVTLRKTTTLSQYLQKILPFALINSHLSQSTVEHRAHLKPILYLVVL